MGGDLEKQRYSLAEHVKFSLRKPAVCDGKIHPDCRHTPRLPWEAADSECWLLLIVSS